MKKVGGLQETGDAGRDWRLNETDTTTGLNGNDDNGPTDGLNEMADNWEK